MKLNAFALFLTTLALAPADAMAGSSDAPTPVMEIVTYRLKPGADVDAYLEAAKATEAFLRETGAVRRRALTVDADGTWTDIIEWTSMEAAKAAEAEAMQRAEFVAFFESFDPSSLNMRHAEIRWMME